MEAKEKRSMKSEAIKANYNIKKIGVITRIGVTTTRNTIMTNRAITEAINTMKHIRTGKAITIAKAIKIKGMNNIIMIIETTCTKTDSTMKIIQAIIMRVNNNTSTNKRINQDRNNFTENAFHNLVSLITLHQQTLKDQLNFPIITQQY